MTLVWIGIILQLLLMTIIMAATCFGVVAGCLELYNKIKGKYSDQSR